MGFENFAVGGEDVDHRAGAAVFPAGGGDDIALAVEDHAIDTAVGGEVVEDTALTGGAVGGNGVGAQLDGLVVVALGHVKGLHVPADQQAIGLGGVEGDAVHFPAAVCLRVGAVDRLVVELEVVGFFAVARIGKPHAAERVEGQVVGAVEALALKLVADDGEPAVFFVANHTATVAGIGLALLGEGDAVAALAGVELAVPVEHQAVGLVGAGAEDGGFAAARVVAEDATGGDIGEEDGFAVPGGAFGEVEGAGYLVEGPGHAAKSFGVGVSMGEDGK